MGGVQSNRWKPNRWDLLTLCVLAVLVCWPWLAVLAFLFGDELHALARRVLYRRGDPPATPPPSYVPVASSLGAVFSFRRAARLPLVASLRQPGKS
jgi:hypothetical protein